VTDSYEHHTIKTNDIHLHVVQAGPQDGPLVILLHGFPDFWYGWHDQIDFLVEHGYRVWIPDQRGYNLSDKPQGIMPYHRDELAKDIIGLIDAAGREKAFVVGHDWGASVAWWLANKYPERVAKLGILNVPHHVAYFDILRKNLRQLAKSWYAFFFQIPRLPEALMRRDNYQPMIDNIRKSGRDDTFSDTDFEQYRQAWSKPGALTAMVNWYRAALRTQMPADPRIHVPTLIIWGKDDFALVPELAERSAGYCDEARIIYIENASHWVQHDAADRVNALLDEFFRA
jgi:epoxide hydrolase 4